MKTVQELNIALLAWLMKDPKNERDFYYLLDLTGVNSQLDLVSQHSIAVKIDVDDLVGVGTTCGRVGNVAFTEKIVSYLKKKGVRFIVALSDDDQLSLNSAIIPLKSKACRKVEEMIYEANGSFRYDSTSGFGWSFFESE